MVNFNFPEISKDKKGLMWFLVGLILFFLIILITRSCNHSGGPGTKEYLKKLSSSKPEAQIDGLIGLGKIGAKSTIPEIEKILSGSSDEKIQQAAIYSIFLLDRDKFLALLKSPQEKVRLLALETFVKQDKDSSYSYLEQGLRDPTLSIRQASLRFLAQNFNKKTIPYVLDLAKNTNEDNSLRIEALNVLGRNADSSNLSDLKTILFSLFAGDQAVREAASGAVKDVELRMEQAKNTETK